jgi:hypothetical protein
LDIPAAVADVSQNAAAVTFDNNVSQERLDVALDFRDFGMAIDAQSSAFHTR